MVRLSFAMVRVVAQSVLRRGDEHVDVDEREEEDEDTPDAGRVSEKTEDERDRRVEFLSTGGVGFFERFFVVVVVVVVDGAFVSVGCRGGGASSLRSFFTSLSTGWVDVEFVQHADAM